MKSKQIWQGKPVWELGVLNCVFFRVKFFSIPLPPPSIIFVKGGNYFGNQKSSSISNGCRVQCSFNLSKCALWGEVGQILAVTLTGPAEPWSPPGPAAPLPIKAETSLPPAQLTPMAPETLCGQQFKKDARTGYGVGGQPSPKLSFAANTFLARAQAWRGLERSSDTQDEPCVP